MSTAAGKKIVDPARPNNPDNTTLRMHFGILFLLSLAVYLPTARNGFVTDDTMQVLLNPQVKDSANWTQAFQGDVWAFSSGKNENNKRGSNYYRPLQILTYEAEYALFGERAWAWHVLNTFLNSAVVLLIYLWVAKLSGPMLAFWAGLFFALHPMHTEAVSWVAALPELQCAFFLVLAMLFYHRARAGDLSRLFLAISTGFFFAAVFSKEAALLFPLILVGYEFLYRQKLLSEWKSWLPWTAPSFVAVFIYLAARISALRGFSPRTEFARAVLSPGQLIVAVPPVFAKYIGKLIVPVGMNYFYAFPLHLHLDFAAIAGLFFFLLFVVVIFALRKNWPLLSFALAWFLLTLAPALSLNSIGENFFTERYLYIPSVGFCILVGWVFNAVWSRANSSSAKAVLATCAGLVLLFYIMQIERRIPVFRSDFALLSYTVQQSPNAYIIQAGMASAYYDRGDEPHALEHGLIALELNPNYALEHINVAGFLSDMGRYDQAIAHLQTALRIEPNYLPSLVNLAKVYTLKGEWKSAAETYERIAQAHPDQAKYFQALAAAARAREGGDKHLETPGGDAARNPRDLATLIQLGDASAQSGDWKRADAAFRSATTLKPGDAALQYKLAVAQSQSGDSAAAILSYQAALKSQPNFPLARLGLAVALSRTGRYQESLVELQRTLKEQPQWEHADQVHMNMAANYEKLGELPNAIQQYKQTLDLNPRLDGARQRLLALSSGH